MNKVLIADDEWLIREGLKTIIKWENYGYKIANSAKDGNECIGMLTQYKPEVCILDIRMPGKTGLEVIKEARAEGLKTHFIILTGHKDFGYIKEAMNYHADNYLLKPIDEDELINSLNQITKIIEDEKSNSPTNNERKIKTYFRSLLGISNEPLPLIPLEDIDWKSYQLLMINIPKGQHSKFEEFLKKEELGLLLVEGSTNMVLLKRYYLRKEGIKTLNNLLTSCFKNKNYDGCIGEVVHNINDLPGTLKELHDLMEHRFFSTQIGVTSKFCFNKSFYMEEDEIDISKQKETMQKLIEVGNEQNIITELKYISNKMINLNFSEEDIKDWYCKLTLGSLNTVAEQNRLTTQNIPGNSDIIMEIQSSTRLFELEEKITHIMNSTIDKRDIQSSKTLIKNMKFIVEKHYMENLKLKDLSNILNYNSAYLGKVFKAEVGECFNVYLDKYRIKMSKEFLQKGYKVYQTAEKVGYAYVDYFHTKFKKYAGMSPLEYKKNIP